MEITNSIDVSSEVTSSQVLIRPGGVEAALPDFAGGNLDVEPDIPRFRIKLSFRFRGRRDAGASSPGGKLLGLFSDDPGLVDEIMEEVKELRRSEMETEP